MGNPRSGTSQKAPPMGRHTTQSAYLLGVEVSSQSKSSIDWRHRAAGGGTRSCAGGAFSRRRSTAASGRTVTRWSWTWAVFTSVTLPGHSPFSIFRLAAFPLQSAGSNLPFLVFFFSNLPLLDWYRNPFMVAPSFSEWGTSATAERKALLACSLSSFCSYTIMHIVCTAPPPPHSLCLQPSLSCGFSLTRSLSLWHTHTLFVFYLYVTAM